MDIKGPGLMATIEMQLLARDLVAIFESGGSPEALENFRFQLIDTVPLPIEAQRDGHRVFLAFRIRGYRGTFQVVGFEIPEDDDGDTHVAIITEGQGHTRIFPLDDTQTLCSDGWPSYQDLILHLVCPFGAAFTSCVPAAAYNEWHTERYPDWGGAQ